VSPVPVHVLFSPSAAGELRRALAESGRADRVISSFDDLSFGPINPPDGRLRAMWVEEELGYSDWEDAVAGTTEFWREAVASGRKIAWISRRSTLEYAGFLEWLWRLGDGACEVADLTDVEVVGHGEDGRSTPPRLALSLALLPTDQILDNRLLDRVQLLAPEVRRRYRDMWAGLRAENAPLRVISSHGLVSAPITFFDLALLSCATGKWQSIARIVGEALANEMEDALLQTGDLLLCARVRALVESGRLESRGDLHDVQRCEIRLRLREN
jgi:Protein of unknown function/Domain of unknown function (DUF1835)